MEQDDEILLDIQLSPESKQDLLSKIEDLRNRAEKGEIVSLAAFGVHMNGQTFGTFSVGPEVPKEVMDGAFTNFLQHIAAHAAPRQ